MTASQLVVPPRLQEELLHVVLHKAEAAAPTDPAEAQRLVGRALKVVKEIKCEVSPKQCEKLQDSIVPAKSQGTFNGRLRHRCF